MSNFTPTPSHVKRMQRDWNRADMLAEAERHVVGYQMWKMLGQPEEYREKVEHYARLALDIADDIQAGALRTQQARARQIEADLEEAGYADDGYRLNA